jgi:tetratricopeptide (TPR) repeat protein
LIDYFKMKFFYIFFLISLIASSQESKINYLEGKLLENLDSKELIFIHQELAEAYLMFDFSKANEHALKVVYYSEKNRDKILQYDSYMLGGRVFFFTGLFDQSAIYLLKAYDLAAILKNDYFLAKTSFNLSALYISINEYSNAEKYLFDAQNYFDSQQTNIDFVTNRQKILNNSAIIYQKTERSKEAKIYFEKAIKFAEENNLTQDLKTTLNAYSSFLIEINLFYEAKAILQKLQLLNTEKNYNASVEATLLLKLYRVNTHLGHNDIALEMLFEGNSIAKSLNSISLLREYSWDLYQFETASNNFEKALFYKNTFDSLVDIENVQLARRQLERKTMLDEFDLMLANIATANSKTAKRHLTFYVSGLIIISIVFLWVIFKKVNKAKKLKTEKQFLVKEVDKKERELMSASLKQLKQKEHTFNVLNQLKSEIDNTSLLSNSSKLKIKKLASEINKDFTWFDFDKRYNEVDINFYKKLEELFPELTLNEKRLCAFLKFEMSTKEIVNITGQSLRAVEIARTRLRKKLGLNKKNIRLTKFLKDL